MSNFLRTFERLILEKTFLILKLVFWGSLQSVIRREVKTEMAEMMEMRKRAEVKLEVLIMKPKIVGKIRLVIALAVVRLVEYFMRPLELILLMERR